jgi:hypothetical protein
VLVPLQCVSAAGVGAMAALVVLLQLGAAGVAVERNAWVAGVVCFVCLMHCGAEVLMKSYAQCSQLGLVYVPVGATTCAAATTLAHVRLIQHAWLVCCTMLSCACAVVVATLMGFRCGQNGAIGQCCLTASHCNT